jgi:hypothetical protein
MEIEYQIKRFDLVKVYFYNLIHSQRTRLIIFGAAILPFAYILFRRFRVFGHLELFDYSVALLFAVVFILALPVFSFLTAKTQKRVLSINPEGLETKIGTKEGKIPWNAVDSISTTQDRIVITGKNANVLTIPTSAFIDNDHRQQFIGLVMQYLANTR